MDQSTIESKKDIKHDYFEVAPGVWGMRIMFVNIYMAVDIATGDWVLIDAGVRGTAGRIFKMADDLFGKDSKPAAIILTHGHFDHVGAIESLLEKWNVPVYSHKLELPYLTGLSSYPPPDPTVGGGLLSLMSWIYPKEPINISGSVQELKEGEIPFFNNWQVIFTPGHTPGHISLFRSSDNVLIAGDAFVTTKQESAFSVMTQQRKICGPPRYFTPDWPAAYKSVKKLMELKPSVVGSGHGQPFSGEGLRIGLENLVIDFYDESIPKEGRYVAEPALANESGVMYVPPANVESLLNLAGKVVIGALTAFAVIQTWKRVRKDRNW